MHWSLYLRHFVCIRCKLPSQRDPRVRSFMCESCMSLHRDEARRATSEVTKAIKNGEMDRADAHPCADCGKQGRDWDHRDHLRPLDVVPLCKGCNVKRGTAFDSVYRPAGEVARPPVFIITDRRVRKPALAQPDERGIEGADERVDSLLSHGNKFTAQPTFNHRQVA